MIKRLLGELPAWAQSDHPMLRYELQKQPQAQTMTNRLMRIVRYALPIALLVFGGYLYATNGLLEPAGINETESIWRILYFPLLIVQILLSIVALSIGIGAIDGERRRQTWDNLRATEVGASIIIRTRWVSVFYRLQSWLVFLVVGRMILTGAILIELTSHRGGYLDLITANITPEIPVILGIVILGATMTANFLLPFTGIGFDVALGLLVSVRIRNRSYAGIIQALIIMARIGVTLFLLFAMTAFLQGTLDIPDSLAWLLMFGFSSATDWGVLTMQFSLLGELWALIPYAVFVGVALLGLGLLQSLATDFLLGLATRVAERNE